jgi:hypothetical protein
MIEYKIEDVSSREGIRYRVISTFEVYCDGDKELEDFKTALGKFIGKRSWTTKKEHNKGKYQHNVHFKMKKCSKCNYRIDDAQIASVKNGTNKKGSFCAYHMMSLEQIKECTKEK